MDSDNASYVSVDSDSDTDSDPSDEVVYWSTSLFVVGFILLMIPIMLLALMPANQRGEKSE